MSQLILDVREKDEFSAENVENSINIPLSQFAKEAPGFLSSNKSNEILLLCRSGKRAKLAQEQIQQLGFGDVKTAIYPGGIIQWKLDGKVTFVAKKFHFPIMRQVQLIAGSLVLIGSVLALTVDIHFAYLSAFVGAGLSFAGATGTCMMAEMLGKLPWNKTQSHCALRG